MESLIFLTYFGLVLLVGLIVTYISRKIKIPNVLLLILVGVLSQYITINGEPLIAFPPLFIEVFAMFALIVIVFDSASQFKLRKFDSMSSSVISVSVWFLLLNFVFLSLTVYFFYMRSISMALLFAALMSGTAPDVTLSVLKDMRSKVLDFLKIESLINTPLVVIFPFIILNFILEVDKLSFISVSQQIAPFLSKIVAGIGAGMLVGLVIFKILKRLYSSEYSPIAVIVSAIITFVLAENLGGDGVLAVTTLGLFFGNMVLRDKSIIQEFSTIFSDFLEILVFILIGHLISIPLTLQFFKTSIMIFGIALVIRYIALQFGLGNSYTIKQKIFAALNNTKGVAVAVIVVVFASYVDIPGMTEISHLALAFMLYSVILSSIFARFAKFFAAPPPSEPTVSSKPTEEPNLAASVVESLSNEKPKKVKLEVKNTISVTSSKKKKITAKKPAKVKKKSTKAKKKK
jgi:potassium/hydrogen antiporter